jgi:glycosyltransferase involved in cell wall biosynthesis
MRIALFNTLTPFVRGGAEILVDDLRDQLIQRGHAAVKFSYTIIDNWNTGYPLSSLAARLFDFSDYDRLIMFKWPTFYAINRNRVTWMFHQFREAYDLFGRQYGLSDNAEGRRAKRFVENSDNSALPNTDKIFAISRTARRLKHYSGIVAEIMLCPLLDYEKYHWESYGDYIYYPSRLNPSKRQLLAVEAMRYTKSNVKLTLDGKPDHKFYLDEILTLIKKYNLADKVTISGKFVSDEDKISRHANSLASVYLPIDEDSPGFVTMEAYYSRKAVISVTDSGGVVDYVRDGETGFIVEPSPRAIAEKIDWLFENRAETAKMGANASKYVNELNINWDDCVGRLLS